jgi:hypothetical protein
MWIILIIYIYMTAVQAMGEGGGWPLNGRFHHLTL